MSEQTDTALRDQLARQRTELANERTLLSYIRTALGFFAVGIPAVWWLEGVVIQSLGVVSLVTGFGGFSPSKGGSIASRTSCEEA